MSSFGDTGFASRWTPVDGVRMHALVSFKGDPPIATLPGAGARPVVIVHGLGAASDAQRPIAGLLARRRPVLVPDLPGFGRSDDPDRILDVDALADSLAAWTAALQLPPAVYLGNSAGCQVISALAQRHPGRVDRVVLQGPTVDPWQRTAIRQVARLALDALFERPTLALVQTRGARQAGVRRLAGTFSAILADRIELRLPQLACPVLVVRGTRDLVVSGRWAAQAARLARLGELRVVPGAPHCMVYSRPRQLAAVTARFLEGVATDSR